MPRPRPVDQWTSRVALTRIRVDVSSAKDLELFRTSTELQEALVRVRDGHGHLLDDGRHKPGGLKKYEARVMNKYLEKFSVTRCGEISPFGQRFTLRQRIEDYSLFGKILGNLWQNLDQIIWSHWLTVGTVVSAVWATRDH